MNNNGKVPKWVFLIVIGTTLTLLGMLWGSTINGLNMVDRELETKVDVMREASAKLNVNIAEINGRLANIERALGIVNGYQKK